MAQGAEVSWVKAEAAKSALTQKDDRAAELRGRVVAKFMEHLQQAEGDFARAQRAQKHRIDADPLAELAAFCTQLLDTATSYVNSTQDRLKQTMRSARAREQADSLPADFELPTTFHADVLPPSPACAPDTQCATIVCPFCGGQARVTAPAQGRNSSVCLEPDTMPSPPSAALQSGRAGVGVGPAELPPMPRAGSSSSPVMSPNAPVPPRAPGSRRMSLASDHCGSISQMSFNLSASVMSAEHTPWSPVSAVQMIDVPSLATVKDRARIGLGVKGTSASPRPPTTPPPTATAPPRPFSAAAYAAEKRSASRGHQRTPMTARAAPPPSLVPGFEKELALLRPEHGDVAVGEDLVLAVACSVLERVAPTLGPFASVVSRACGIVASKVYDTPAAGQGPAAGTLCASTTQYLERSPQYAVAHAMAWENAALVEELERAKLHMKLWGWSIWRNVVKGMRYYGRVLRGIDVMAERRYSRAALNEAWQHWRAFIKHVHATRRVDRARGLLVGFQEEGSLEERISDCLAMVEAQQGIIEALRAELKTAKRVGAELQQEVERMALRVKCKDARALDAVEKHAQTAELLAAESKRVENLAAQVRLLRSRRNSVGTASDRWNDSEDTAATPQSHRRSRSTRQKSTFTHKQHRAPSAAHSNHSHQRRSRMTRNTSENPSSPGTPHREPSQSPGSPPRPAGLLGGSPLGGSTPQLRGPD
eukprot:TRINITY_DN20797_c0_g1_i1.p1 TRINITY_DN20797_c0_g1~~TRINITY_DN20797_c0_g1_i1.p1  ORF type:complete len:817 (+),score=194.54 TRINITY_DN20797_c0_g1_i1:333-2453(+)